MRNLVVLFSTILVLVVFSSCEQNELDTLETLNTNTTQDTTAMPYDAAKAEEVAVTLEKIDTAALESRSRRLVYSNTFEIGYGAWASIIFDKHELTPNYKYTAVVTPIHGNPNLYNYGYDSYRYDKFRLVRSSTYQYGTDENYLTLADLYYSETKAYFSVYGATHTKFVIQIYAEPICTVGCLAGNYYIGSYLGTYLDVYNASAASGTKVWAYAFNGSIAQRWSLISAGGDYYYVRSDLGTYLDVYNANTASGTKVWTYAFNGSIAQKWRVISRGDGYYYFQSAVGTYLDVYNAGTASGTPIWAYAFNGSSAQRWKLYAR
jgi:hypothetical protein